MADDTGSKHGAARTDEHAVSAPEPAVRVLLVASDKGDVTAVRHALATWRRGSFEVTHTELLASALELLEKQEHDAVLLDLELADANGLAAVEAVLRKSQDIPVVVLCASDDEDMAVHAMMLGAQDYVLKSGGGPGDESHSGVLLSRILSYAMERQGLLVELRETRQRQQHIATHDVLTGLPNRQLLRHLLRQSFAQARRGGETVAVLSLDIDRFQSLNETLGYGVGDELLRVLAGRLRGGLQEGDVAARLGGDEFVVTVSNLAKLRDAKRVAERILNRLREPVSVEGRELRVTPSIGIAGFPADGTEVIDVIRNAEIAMYDAKERGGNDYQFFSVELDDAVGERFALEQRLRGAVERGELVLFYQPQVEARSGELSGVEALVRWQHPELGLLSPIKFIPMAEETGLIVEIGRWVLERACADKRAWVDAGYPDIRVAVNVASQQLLRGDFRQTVADALETHRIEPAKLELEITENGIMEDITAVTAQLKRVKELGVRISIDDFGTGSSSLHALAYIPRDELKIDRSFVVQGTTSPDCAAIVTAILAMARSMRVETVAEGVETNSQLEFVRARGCDRIQGYLFAKPMPLKELEVVLRYGLPGARVTLRLDQPQP